MWETIELHEIRVFLALAEELHFARTAERLGLTQSRVSQILRQLERKLGAELVYRTSRRVALTSSGERFRAEAGAAYRQLAEALVRSQVPTGVEGTLRLGWFHPCLAGPQLIAIIEEFEARHPGCKVHISEISCGDDPLDKLRRGDVDLLAIRLPLDGPDLVIGPTLSSEPRVLAVCKDHRLASRDQVSIEEVADHHVTDFAGAPTSWIEAFVPRRTPGGRPLVRIPESPVMPYELAALVARGKIVHPTVPSFADNYGQPGIVYVPITDMQSLTSALVWRRQASSSARLFAFVEVARDVLPDPSTTARVAEGASEPVGFSVQRRHPG